MTPTPDVSPSLGPASDFEAGSVSAIAARAVERGAALLGAKAGAAYLIQPGQHLLERISFRGGESEEFPPTLADDSTHPAAVSSLKGEVLWGPDGLTALPLIVGSRHDGVLLFKSGGPISHDELYLAQTVARQAAHALDHARMVEAE
ncbi:MAG: GAF domain-containing protein, partial [Myxococcaceae bacterium]